MLETLGIILLVVLTVVFPRLVVCILAAWLLGGGAWWWLFGPLAFIGLVLDCISKWIVYDATH